jgi:predicted DCC family thiol-disulfide oxidoreductase YuxK
MTKDKLYIILYDGACNLCNNLVNFIARHLRHSKRGQFRFITLKSEEASEYFIRFNKQGLNKGSMALIRNESVYLKSDAVIQILKCLNGIMPIFYTLIIFPRFIRDPIYNLVAGNRYKLF